MSEEPELLDVLRLLVRALLICLPGKTRRRFVRAAWGIIDLEARKLVATPGPRSADKAIRLANLRRFWEDVAGERDSI